MSRLEDLIDFTAEATVAAKELDSLVEAAVKLRRTTPSNVAYGPANKAEELAREARKHLLQLSTLFDAEIGKTIREGESNVIPFPDRIGPGPDAAA